MTDLFPDTVNGHLKPENMYGAAFLTFWDASPKVGSKFVAQRHFNKMNDGTKQFAMECVKHYYDWWRKQNPKASAIHVSTYLSQRRFEDDDFHESLSKQKAIKEHDPLETAERNIKSGKRFLCTHISNTVVTELLRRGRVTEDQIKGVGL